MLITVILIGAAVITACAVNLKPSKAAGDVAFVSVNEIYGNCHNVQTLYDLIGGAKDTSFDKITTMATRKLNAADIRANTYNKTADQDVQVTFGGQVWDVVYLSTTKDNRPILTLWLHDSFTSSQWNNWYSENADVKYPSSMYGTSYIRSLVINGGQYAENKDTLVDYEPVADYVLQEFLAGGRYADLIVTPSLVEWQRKGQSTAKLNIWEYYDSPNENWGDEEKSIFTVSQGQGSMNWFGRDGYGVWQDDNLWLPSISEVSYITLAIWGGISSNQSNDTGSWTWTRTSDYNNPAYARMTVHKYIHLDEKYNIRPALHLDLTALNATRTDDHNYGEWQITEPTCTETGVRERECQNCGNVAREIIAATGHDYSVASFNKDTGITTMECSVCHTPSDITYPCTNKDQGHSFIDTVINPDCEHIGHTKHICQYCEYSYQDSYLPALGHSYGNWVTTEPATTDHAGEQKRTCEHCGAEQTRTLPALAGTTTNGGKDNSGPLLWGIIIGVIAVLAGCGGLAWLLLAVFKPRRQKKTAAA